MRTILTTTAAVALALATFAQDPAGPTDKEASYAQALEKRAQDTLAALNLSDPAKAGRVHDAVVAQYRAVRDWHSANDAKLKALEARIAKASPAEAEPLRAEAAQLRASLKQRHDAYLARLSNDLTPGQLEQVKDKMTYNVVHVTHNAYRRMLPTLTTAQDAKILDLLKEAREEAMDAGSAEEKHAVFGRYKGRINNYLSAEGYDLKQASKDLADKIKAQGTAK